MPKNFSLKKYKDINNLFKGGARYFFYPLNFCFLPANEFHILISISKITGNAVFRNLIKRRIKNAVHNSKLKSFSIHCAVFIKTGANSTKAKKIKKDLKFNHINDALTSFTLFYQKHNKV